MEMQIIDAVCMKEVLWNENNKDYENSEVRQEAWIEIASNLEMNVGDLIDQWTRLRKSFENAFHEVESKTKETGSNDEWKNCFFPYYNMMMFLKPHIKLKTTEAVSSIPEPYRKSSSPQQIPTFSPMKSLQVSPSQAPPRQSSPILNDLLSGFPSAEDGLEYLARPYEQRSFTSPKLKNNRPPARAYMSDISYEIRKGNKGRCSRSLFSRTSKSPDSASGPIDLTSLSKSLHEIDTTGRGRSASSIHRSNQQETPKRQTFITRPAVASALQSAFQMAGIASCSGLSHDMNLPRMIAPACSNVSIRQQNPTRQASLMALQIDSGSVGMASDRGLFHEFQGLARAKSLSPVRSSEQQSPEGHPLPSTSSVQDDEMDVSMQPLDEASPYFKRRKRSSSVPGARRTESPVRAKVVQPSRIDPISDKKSLNICRHRKNLHKSPLRGAIKHLSESLQEVIHMAKSNTSPILYSKPTLSNTPINKVKSMRDESRQITQPDSAESDTSPILSVLSNQRTEEGPSGYSPSGLGEIEMASHCDSSDGSVIRTPVHSPEFVHSASEQQNPERQSSSTASVAQGDQMHVSLDEESIDKEVEQSNFPFKKLSFSSPGPSRTRPFVRSRLSDICNESRELRKSQEEQENSCLSKRLFPEDSRKENL